MSELVIAHKSGAEVAQELAACIGCHACLLACPAVSEPLSIATLNRQTLSGPISEPVARFAHDCSPCGACIAPCPVGLHRDLMMLWLKVRLARSQREEAV
jgi:Na+-translocating ferredoxin:NAD+ oxidoreductase RnfC subunit